MDPNNFDYADNADLQNSHDISKLDTGPFVGTQERKGMLWHKKRTKLCWLGMAQALESLWPSSTLHLGAGISRMVSIVSIQRRSKFSIRSSVTSGKLSFS